MAGTAYGALLRTPGAARFSAAALVGRMPISMLGIGILLLVEQQRDSYALAGATTAAEALGLATLGPVVSRLVDRFGQGRVLPLALVVHAAGLVALLLLATGGGPAVLLLLAAVLTGGALPPLGSCVRARWSHLLTAQQRTAESPTAFALEAVADEVVFVAGPLLVVLSAALVDPIAGLLLALVLCAGGTVALVAQRSTAPPAHEVGATASRSAVRARGMGPLVGSLAGVGLVFGSLEVAMVAFAEELGSDSGSGLLLALVALGSAVAGLAYGARTWRTPLLRRYLLALVVLLVGVLPLLAPSSVALMVPAALLAGVAISPTLIASYGLVEELVPVRVRTEGFTWLTSGLYVGSAVGSTAGGAVAEAASPRVAFLVCAGGALLALSVAVAGRRSMQAPEIFASTPC